MQFKSYQERVQQREKYYNTLGEFLTVFSEMETALIAYCSIITYLEYHREGFNKYSPYTIGQRVKFISDFIKEKLPSLKEEWDTIKEKINLVNEDRRHLVHGIGRTGFLMDTITTSVPKKGKMIDKEFSLEDIRKTIDKIHHINTGDNGITGEFQIKFYTHRYDLHNDLIDNAQKICYRINGIALTKHKG